MSFELHSILRHLPAWVVTCGIVPKRAFAVNRSGRKNSFSIAGGVAIIGDGESDAMNRQDIFEPQAPPIVLPKCIELPQAIECVERQAWQPIVSRRSAYSRIRRSRPPLLGSWTAPICRIAGFIIGGVVGLAFGMLLACFITGESPNELMQRLGLPSVLPNHLDARPFDTNRRDRTARLAPRSDNRPTLRQTARNQTP